MIGSKADSDLSGTLPAPVPRAKDVEVGFGRESRFQEQGIRLYSTHHCPDQPTRIQRCLFGRDQLSEGIGHVHMSMVGVRWKHSRVALLVVKKGCVLIFVSATITGHSSAAFNAIRNEHY